MPGPVCLCYLAPPACNPPAGLALSSPGPPFTLSVRFLSRGFSLSRGLFCCQAAYLFCWGCSTYLHPSASWRVSFVSCDLSRVSLRHVTVILHRWDTTTSLSHFTIAWLTISFLLFLLGVFVFMAQPVRQSAHIRDPAYHPHTGWSLPEIISVLSLIPFFFPPVCENSPSYLGRRAYQLPPWKWWSVSTAVNFSSRFWTCHGFWSCRRGLYVSIVLLFFLFFFIMCCVL